MYILVVDNKATEMMNPVESRFPVFTGKTFVIFLLVQYHFFIARTNKVDFSASFIEIGQEDSDYAPALDSHPSNHMNEFPDDDNHNSHSHQDQLSKSGEGLTNGDQNNEQQAAHFNMSTNSEAASEETMINQHYPRQMKTFLTRQRIRDTCDLDRGSQRNEYIDNSYLIHCSRYKLENLLSNELLMSIMHHDSGDCSKILDEFVQLDEVIGQFDLLFKNLLTRYNCHNGYSVKWSCEDCKVSEQSDFLNRCRRLDDKVSILPLCFVCHMHDRISSAVQSVINIRQEILYAISAGYHGNATSRDKRRTIDCGI